MSFSLVPISLYVYTKVLNLVPNANGYYIFTGKHSSSRHFRNAVEVAFGGVDFGYPDSPPDGATAEAALPVGGEVISLIERQTYLQL